MAILAVTSLNCSNFHHFLLKSNYGKILKVIERNFVTLNLAMCVSNFIRTIPTVNNNQHFKFETCVARLLHIKVTLMTITFKTWRNNSLELSSSYLEDVIMKLIMELYSLLYVVLKSVLSE